MDNNIVHFKLSHFIDKLLLTIQLKKPYPGSSGESGYYSKQEN